MATTVTDLMRKAFRPANRTVADIIRKAMDGPEIIQAQYTITKVAADDKRIVTGQVYAADTIDAHGHFMTKAELERVAHQFMADGLLTSIDVQHDNETVDATIVESFIARKGDPDFEEGSWVASVKIDDPFVWQLVKDGVLNGYSFEIMTFKEDVNVEVEYQSWYYGFTDPDPHDKHDHPFIVRLDENGGISWGSTGLGSDGSPAHPIQNSNITAAVDGKTHRIHFKETP
jgi:hypothetical protein